jgi:hypothetical protein
MLRKQNTVRSKGNNHHNMVVLGILCFMIALLLIYMIWDICNRSINEGFNTRQSKTAKSSNKTSTTKSGNKSNKLVGQSKLSMMKNGKYNPNDDLKNYGMDGRGDEETELDKRIDEMGTKMGEDLLVKLGNKRSKGKRDNFKNVINEVDNINPGAFDLTSIGGTIRRYNENFNNRLNYAKSKNEGDNLEATMAQGKVIFDEFKKIFLFTDMFS